MFEILFSSFSHISEVCSKENTFIEKCDVVDRMCIILYPHEYTVLQTVSLQFMSQEPPKLTRHSKTLHLYIHSTGTYRIPITRHGKLHNGECRAYERQVQSLVLKGFRSGVGECRVRCVNKCSSVYHVLK